MAATVNENKSAGKAIVRVIQRESAKALEEFRSIRQAGSPQDKTLFDSVHSLRRHLKRGRAMLRFIRTSLGSERYHDSNARFRDVARPFAAARDAEVLLKTFKNLCSKAERHAGPQAESLANIAEQLATLQKEAARQAIHAAESASSTEAWLKKAAHHKGHWLQKGAGWRILADGLRRGYRNAKRARHLARHDVSDEHLHEWRKQNISATSWKHCSRSGPSCWTNSRAKCMPWRIYLAGITTWRCCVRHWPIPPSARTSTLAWRYNSGSTTTVGNCKGAHSPTAKSCSAIRQSR